MPNKDLSKKYFNCPITGDKISYENMKKIKSFFDNYDGDGTDEEYKNKGGERMKNWINNTLSDSRDSIYYEKKSRMDAGEENQFIKTHTKDKDNANPTKVRLPKIAKSSKNKYIMANRTVYESIDEEIDTIKYLIEYMNNNKNNL